MTQACPPEQSLGQMTVGEDFVVVFAALGVSEATATLFPLLGSLLTIFLISRIARILAGPSEAVAAAFLAAIFPLAVEESTRVLPGPLINLLIAASAYFFLAAETRLTIRPVYLALSGVLLASIPWAGHLGLKLLPEDITHYD